MVGQRWRLALGQVTYRTDLSLYMLGCCHQGLHWQAHLRQGFLKVSQLLWGFPDSSVGKESACNAGDPSLIPGSGRSPGEGIGHPLQYSWASLVAQLVKNLPAMWETLVRSLGWEGPLEKEKATHSSILVWRSMDSIVI